MTSVEVFLLVAKVNHQSIVLRSRKVYEADKRILPQFSESIAFLKFMLYIPVESNGKVPWFPQCVEILNFMFY